MATHANSTPAPSSRRGPSASRQLVAKPRPGIPFPDLASIPEIYGMKLQGDCLAPDLLDGDEVVFSSTEPVQAGDLVHLILRPELVPPGGLQCAIKRLVMAIPPYVTFPWTENPKSDVHALVLAEQRNPPGQYAIKCDRLLAVHRFVRVQNRQVQS